MKNLKRNVVISAVVLFVGAAVYLNWSYNNSWGEADEAMVAAEDEAMANAELEYQQTLEEVLSEAEETETASVSDYFAEARLTRQQSRDEALSLLETAATTDSASQEVIDSAVDEISAMAELSLMESQIENMLIAKDFADCMVFMSDDSITVAVPAPEDGLSAAAVARITDAITSETNYTASQLQVIEIKN